VRLRSCCRRLSRATLRLTDDDTTVPHMAQVAVCAMVTEGNRGAPREHVAWVCAASRVGQLVASSVSAVRARAGATRRSNVSF